MRKFVSLLLAILFMFLCTGCSNASDDTETSAFVGGDTYFFDNKLFFIEENNIKFISYDTFESYYFCFEPMCTHTTNDCLSCIENGTFYHLVIDEDASENGIVMYVSYNYLEDTTNFNVIQGIMKIEASKNKKSQVIHNTDCEAINQLTLWNGKIYFSATLNDYFFKIFSVDKDGNNLVQLTDNEDYNCYIHSISQNTLYYFDDLGNIYSMQSPESTELVFTSKYPYGVYINNGYLYYCDNEVFSDNKNEALSAFDFSKGEFTSYVWHTYSYSYYRIPLNDTTQIPEKVTDNVVRSQKMLVKDNYFYITSVTHKYLGSYSVYDPEYKIEVPNHVAVTTDGIQKINLDTLEIDHIKLNDDWQIYYILYADNNKIIFYGENMTQVLNNKEHSGMSYVVYDIASGTYKIM